jgi:hypothetical protein
LPVLTQAEAAPLRRIWGEAAPAFSVPADNFSARWTSTQMFNAGSYRISAMVDDGVRVFVDGVRLIDEYHGATGVVYVNGITLSTGQHTLIVEYFEATGQAYLDFAVTPTDVPITTSNEWIAAYYNNTTLTGSPVITPNEFDLTHNWQTDAPVFGVTADYFSARWTRTQSVNAGVYRIRVAADDGVRVFVDGAKILGAHVRRGVLRSDRNSLSAVRVQSCLSSATQWRSGSGNSGGFKRAPIAEL